MSEVREKAVAEEQKELNTDGMFWIWVLLMFAPLFSGWGSPENPRISELEKKVARLEGQMSMVSGRFRE